jgi:hypothetical protein
VKRIFDFVFYNYEMPNGIYFSLKDAVRHLIIVENYPLSIFPFSQIKMALFIPKPPSPQPPYYLVLFSMYKAPQGIDGY